jgi:hypothetical protein
MRGLPRGSEPDKVTMLFAKGEIATGTVESKVQSLDIQDPKPKTEDPRPLLTVRCVMRFTIMNSRG